MYMAPSTALSAALNGSDRSMPPPIITTAMPIAMTASVEAWTRMLMKLFSLKKDGA